MTDLLPGGSNFIKILALVLLCLIPTVLGCPAGENTASPVGSPEEKGDTQILVYTAAGVKEPVEKIVEAYTGERQNGEAMITFVFNNSGRLLAQAELSGKGDLYIASDDFYMKKAKQKNLLEKWEQAAVFIPAIVVPRGNPAGIEELSDLAKEGLKVILCEESAAMGRAAERLLQKNGLFEAVSGNIESRVTTAPQVALTIALGQGDAGITGINSVGEMEHRVEVVPIPEGQNVTTKISIGVLSSTELPEESLDLMQFILSEAGEKIFEAHGFGLPERQ